MINWLVGKRDVGLYSFGFKMANFIDLIFIQSFGLSYLPALFKKEKTKDNKVFYSKMLLFYTVIVSSIILLFIATYEFALIPFVKNDTYLLGLIIVPIISFSFLIHGMNNFASTGIYLKNKTKLLIYTSTITAALNIVLNYFMIPAYGFVGAAFATLISQIINTGMMIILSQKLFYINYPWKKIFITITGLILMLGLIIYWDKLSFGYNLAFNIFIVIIFIFILYTMVLSNQEKQTIILLINKTIKRKSIQD
jgi:O-antigen/teichoic acid export membrane protein